MVKFERNHMSLFVVLFLFSLLTIKIDAAEKISENVLSVLREMVRNELVVMSSDSSFNVEGSKGLVHITKRAAVKAEDDVTVKAESVTQLLFTRSNCRKYLLIMAKRLMKYLNGCVKQLKIDHPGPGEFDRFFNCALRCAMTKVSMLEGNGLMTIESFNVFKTKHVPERYHNVTQMVMGDCLQEHSTKVKCLSEDPQCLGFGDFFKCAQSFVGDNC